ncbi:MAG TPA: NUDIX domain-containing protein [Bacteroidales bacterium]|nr:NUDIX domain-containing protein [Bacteroidales bacterium]
MNENVFNIRVYGIIFNEQRNAVLVSDEYQLNTFMTKFPGGGLDYGEGTIDCLKREIIEETGHKICNIEHFYTTDFFQKALFFDNQQLISIYYTCQLEGQQNFPTSTQPWKFEKAENGQERFRWNKLSELNTEQFTFPIDKIVAGMLTK